MQNNNTNYKNDGLEILDLILLLWKRKYIILLTLQYIDYMPYNDNRLKHG